MTIVADLGSLVTVLDSGSGLAYSLQGMRNSAHTLTDISEGIAADSRAAALGSACQGASGPIFAASVAAPAGSALVEFADLVESISSGTSIAVALLAANIIRVADAIEAGDQAAASTLRQVGLGVDR